MLTPLRQTWRTLTREPGFTITALLTLALGIGVSTGMFSFVDAVLLKPVDGIADEDRLVLVGEARPPDSSTRSASIRCSADRFAWTRNAPAPSTSSC